MKSSNFIKKNIKNLNIITIIKLLLCLYILFAIHIKNENFLKIVNDNGIKVFILLLIIYLITIDYTLSLLISICLIISILIYNKKDIDIIKKNKKIHDMLNNKKNNETKDNETKDNETKDNETKDNETKDNETKNNETKELNSAIVSLENNIDGFIENLKIVQDNTFSSINNNLYMSGNYNNSIISTQGDFQKK